MTVIEWLQEAQARLASAGIESNRLEAQVLAMHVLLVDRSWLLAHPETEFPDLAGEGLLQRRERGEPLAYITGRREFYGREFSVRPGVLIPRQDTEILVETALAAMDWPNHEHGDVSILDLGVGSGAIAVTLKLERSHSTVTGIDISPLALEIAGDNARSLEADIRLLLSDGFSSIPNERFDLIVSNPPYIGNEEILDREVAEFEPAQALFSGPTGLEFYERLAREAGAHLVENGRLIVEVGHTQSNAVQALFESSGWKHQQTVRDLCGIERVVEVSRP